MFSIVFYTSCWSVRLTSCCCRIARIHVSYCVLHALEEYQGNELLLKDCLNLSFLLHFTCIRATAGQRIALVGSLEFAFSIAFCTHQGYQPNELLLRDRPNSRFSIVFYTHWVQISVRNRFCGSAHIHDGSIVKLTLLSAIINDVRNFCTCFAYLPRWTIYGCL